jgi:hypothetical protein
MAAGWFTCRVTLAGPAEDGNIYIALSDTGGAFPSQWFVSVASMKNEMLATALAAIASGKNVTTALSDTVPYSTINRFYEIA